MAMAKSFLCSILLLLLQIYTAASFHGAAQQLHEPKHRFRKSLGRHIDTLSSPYQFFEVSKPILSDPSSSSSPCTSLILSHSFANTYSLPPAIANYTPPSSCGLSWHQIILTWTGACQGRQYDRIAAVWLSGVELLRTCTAEPTSNGVFWQIKKDVTRFSSLFKHPQLVILELANVVDSTYTGIFHINITLDFYKPHRHTPSPFPPDGPPDLVLPISVPDPLSQGYWFQLSSENDTASKTFLPPTNIYRAVLEICVSFHGDDEFWYSNPPNDYIEANDLVGYPGNGPFREVQVFLDDAMVGAVWPFPVIYTGGINPLFWRPAAAIGAFNLPTYDLELTPFVGLLVDGNNHTISMRVENAIGSWPVDANLHLWLDPKTSQTSGGLLSYDRSPSFSQLISDFKGLDGTFHTTAKRSISFSGYIVCSLGNLFATASYSFAFDNELVFKNDSAVEIVNQVTETRGHVTVKTPSKVVFSQERSSFFPLYLYCQDYSESSNSYMEECNITHSLSEQISTVGLSGSTFDALVNAQDAQGSMTVVGSTVTAGVGALQQHYDFDSTQGCYDRSLSTKNYSVLLDLTDLSCNLYSAQY